MLYKCFVFAGIISIYSQNQTAQYKYNVPMSVINLNYKKITGAGLVGYVTCFNVESPSRHIGNERMYLTLYKVSHTPFHIQGGESVTVTIRLRHIHIGQHIDVRQEKHYL